MRIHEFVFEVAVEFLRDLGLRFVRRGEDGLEMDVGYFLVVLGLLGSFLGESFGCDEVRVGIGPLPFGEEHVVFEIRGGDVGDAVAEGLEFAGYGGGEGHRGEDGELPGGETDLRGRRG